MSCFLDIGRDSLFQFMLLTFGGTNSKWTSSNFVLLDGNEADFQPSRSFKSLTRLNFQWLLNKTFNFGERASSNGLLIFNSGSDVELYYKMPEIKGFYECELSVVF